MVQKKRKKKRAAFIDSTHVLPVRRLYPIPVFFFLFSICPGRWRGSEKDGCVMWERLGEFGFRWHISVFPSCTSSTLPPYTHGAILYVNFHEYISPHIQTNPSSPADERMNKQKRNKKKIYGRKSISRAANAKRNMKNQKMVKQSDRLVIHPYVCMAMCGWNSCTSEAAWIHTRGYTYVPQRRCDISGRTNGGDGRKDALYSRPTTVKQMYSSDTLYIYAKKLYYTIYV